MKVVPYPKDWLAYKPRDEMKSETLGIFAHSFVKNGEQGSIKEAYKKIVDIAIEEQTCSVLSASQSLVLPNHHLLYEEWADYDEFFDVQVKRSYRSAFYRWLDPIRKGPISPEFTRVFCSSGTHPSDIAPRNAYALVQSFQIEAKDYEKAFDLFYDYITSKNKSEKNIFANAHQSINNPNHFLLYEVWSDFAALIESQQQNYIRTDLNQQLERMVSTESPEPCSEIFQIYYDPQKYQHKH
jgi:quinol monooxygenase YgiN